MKLSALLTLSMLTQFTVNRAMSIMSVDFEVFGRVQGVFFRKFTKSQAETLRLRGWCKNTELGTVQGTVEGPQDKVEIMKEWLRTKGSPSSFIEKAEFTNEHEVSFYTHENFSIVS